MVDLPLLDDRTILDDDRLFRRVPPNQVVEGADGCHRPSSAVFKTPELSVNIESLMILQGRPPEDTLTRYPGDYLTSVMAFQVREHGQGVVKATDPPNDPAHGLVLGKKTGRFANAMVRGQLWIVPPQKK
jgi:hypothetical protein